jgi:hypothetical protein
MAKSTCQACSRTVLMINIGGQNIATDPELISVVRVTQRMGDGNDVPRLEMASKTDFARRLHAERCEDYQNQARRERLAAEMRQYTANQKRAPRRNKGL